MDVRAELERWMDRARDSDVAYDLKMLAEQDEEAWKDAFYRDLGFGTAGLRGVVGAGTNRMNVYTVAKATQGFADYLNATFDSPSVAIARDSRRKGEEFCRVAAEVLAANGIKAHLYERIEPTPALSFAVRYLKCSAGICMTASHNPAPYNGYKAYGPDGCQITSDAATAIQQAIDAIDIFDDVVRMPFDQACEQGLISTIGEDCLDAFIDAVARQSCIDPAAVGSPLKLVYTPLNGTGLECVERILDRVGIVDIHVVPEQREPDSEFTTCPYPNPEIREALEKGIALCEQVSPDLLLATDPDADRVGVAVKNGDDYTLLSGNETGILLLDYLIRMREAAGTLPSDAVAVSTIVSTVMIDPIAAEHGVTVKRVLTGFKYIGDVIGRLEAEGHENRFLFGFEESYGYLCGTHVRDKDAIVASMLICQMAQHYKARGMNLAQAIDDLYARYGYFANRTVSLSFEGADGAATMQAIMTKLRTMPPATVAGATVEAVVDYAEGVEGLPSADVVELRLPDTAKVIIRPSGTEPKIKAYLFVRCDKRIDTVPALDRLESAARELLS